MRRGRSFAERLGRALFVAAVLVAAPAEVGARAVVTEADLLHDAALVGSGDGRRPLTPQEGAYFFQIGVVGDATGSWGTAFTLLRGDIIVTASHALLKSDGTPRDFPTFHPGGPTRPGHRVMRVWAGDNGDARGHDWAIGLLDRPVPGSPPPFGYWTPATKAELVAGDLSFLNVAFHSDTGAKMVAKCRAFPRHRSLFPGMRNLFLHTCDTAPGASGSPLLVFNHGRYYVAGIHLGRQDAQFNIAIRLDEQFRRTLERVLEGAD